MSDLGETLKDRGGKYGPFMGHARVVQNLKMVVRHALDEREKTLADDQSESLDMILHKIGRIVNGDPDYADSWVDIAGYAKLVADRLERETVIKAIKLGGDTFEMQSTGPLEPANDKAFR